MIDPTQPLILYVDDEHASRVVFEQSFGKRFRVKCAESAQRALEIMAEEPVAVLVTDQRMPGMTGEELLERVKVLSPDTVRIVVTAYSDLEPILRAVNDGLVVRYLIKPWDRAELTETLRWALEFHELGRVNSAIQLRLVQTERVLTLGQATAAVIHDLRQPLASIELNVSSLGAMMTAAPIVARVAASRDAVALDRDERRALSELATDLPELVDELRISIRFMNEVLEQLAELRERSVTSNERATSDLVPLVRLAVAMCRQEAVEHRCLVVNELPESLPSVRATSAQILQILINLVRNAQQAVGQNERGGRVVIHASVEDDAVRVTVRDDGPGMPEEVRAKLGTPFFTTRPEGTGLGVAQVRRLLGALRGTFDVESAPGKGTRVTFSLPRSS